MSTSGPADLAIVGGEVRTIDAEGTRASAVAIREGRIVAVGSDELVRAASGPATEMIDARVEIDPETKVGVGPFVPTVGGRRYFGHGGSNEGFQCYMIASVEGGKGAERLARHVVELAESGRSNFRTL